MMFLTVPMSMPSLLITFFLARLREKVLLIESVGCLYYLSFVNFLKDCKNGFLEFSRGGGCRCHLWLEEGGWVALWGSLQFRSPTDRFRAGGREGMETVGVAISVVGFGVERRPLVESRVGAFMW